MPALKGPPVLARLTAMNRNHHREAGVKALLGIPQCGNACPFVSDRCTSWLVQGDLPVSEEQEADHIAGYCAGNVGNKIDTGSGLDAGGGVAAEESVQVPADIPGCENPGRNGETTKIYQEPEEAPDAAFRQKECE